MTEGMEADTALGDAPAVEEARKPLLERIREVAASVLAQFVEQPWASLAPSFADEAKEAASDDLRVERHNARASAALHTLASVRGAHVNYREAVTLGDVLWPELASLVEPKTMEKG